MNEGFRNATANLEAHQKLTDEEYFSIALDPARKDATLSEKGLEEAANVRSLVAALNIKLVLVSPMRRAVMTAIISTAGTGAKIVLLPSLRERMTFKNTMCSTPAELKEMAENIRPNVEGDFEVDYSLLRDDLWFLD